MSKARTRLPFEYPVEARTVLEAHVRSHALEPWTQRRAFLRAVTIAPNREAKLPAPRLRRPARNRACGSSGSAARGDDARRCWRTRSLCASSPRQLLSSECKRLHHSLLQKKRVEQGFREFFKDDEQSGVTFRLVLCAVGVPDSTGVEDIFRLTVGKPRFQPPTLSRCIRCAASVRIFVGLFDSVISAPVGRLTVNQSETAVLLAF